MEEKKISSTRQSCAIASTINVSILALTLFTPECPSGCIHRGLHTQKFIAEKNQYVTFTSTSFPRSTCYYTIAILHTMCFLMRNRQSEQRFVGICKLQRYMMYTPVGDFPCKIWRGAQLGHPKPEISIFHARPFNALLHHARKHVVSWD